jgi:Acetyltransferase (GNAT) domain
MAPLRTDRPQLPIAGQGSSFAAGVGVREVDPRTDRRWEAFVASHPEGSIYQHPAWLDVLAQESDDSQITLACEDADGQICGVLPLCSTRGMPLGLGGPRAASRLSSLPRTPVSGPLAATPEVAAALVAAGLRYASAGGSRQLELKPPISAGPVEGVQTFRWSRLYLLDLPADPGQLRFGDSRTHASIKRAVAKATRAGVSIRVAEDETDLRAWYPLYLEAMRAHVVPPRPYSFFTSVWRTLKPLGLMRLMLAETMEGRQRTVLAGSIFLMFGQAVIFAFNGRSRAHLDLRPNDAIHWQAIHDACSEGFRRYDLGEVEENQPGLERFKRKWGAQPRQLYRYYHPSIPEQAERESSVSRAQRVRESLWRRVPLRVTEMIGARLYRYL